MARWAISQELIGRLDGVLRELSVHGTTREPQKEIFLELMIQKLEIQLVREYLGREYFRTAPWRSSVACAVAGQITIVPGIMWTTIRETKELGM